MNTEPPTTGLLRYRFAILLGFLALLLLCAPVLHVIEAQRVVARITMTAALSAILLAAAFAVCSRRLQAVIALSLTIPALVVQAASIVFDTPALDVARNALGLAALGYVIAILLRHLFTSRRITLDTIAASLCVYLLLGVLWSLGYSLVDQLAPGSFRFAYEDAASGSMSLEGGREIFTLYFSFVTLTTLGYGDIVPASDPARMAAVTEAVVGQIYLTVLVARLVGMHISLTLGDRRTAV